MSACHVVGTPKNGQDAVVIYRCSAVGGFIRRAVMRSWPRIAWAVSICLVLAACSIARADNEGQADLDRATDVKLSAKSIDDLETVIGLCRKALDAGLDTDNGKFATELLAGTLTQRAEIVCTEIFESPTPPVRWPEFRQLAVGDLEESVKLDPEQLDAQYLIGRLHSLPGGDRQRAVAALDEAVRLSADQPSRQAKVLLLRANLRVDPEARLDDYTRAVKLAPHSVEIIRSRGLFHLAQTQYEEAIADLDTAIELDPKNPDLFEAKGVAQFLLKRYDDALKSLNAAIELAPESALLVANRARIYAVQGDFDKALAELGKALQLEPRSLPVLLLRARVYQQAKDMKHALEDVNEVLRIRPGYPEGLQVHALLSAGSGKLDEAIGDLEELKDLAPNNTELRLQLGMFYSAGKRPQQAIDTFTQVLEVDPKNWMAHRGRADAYLNLGKQAEARDDYQAALDLQPDDPGILNNLAWILATSPEDSLRDGKRAIELATKACKETDYHQAHILSTLAAGYAETGDFATAVHWSQEAVAIGQKEQLEQLAKELKSYEEKKPWREAMPVEFDEPANVADARGAVDPSEKPADDADESDADAADDSPSDDKPGPTLNSDDDSDLPTFDDDEPASKPKSAVREAEE
ncbi:MAG TPA: tetratricopeptide repeat protein [Pirellulales bacterium]|nr:tetratricopeptide repeat protein [Pirellulales bacterium]